MTKGTALRLIDGCGCLAFLGALFAPVGKSVLLRGGLVVAVLIVFITVYEVVDGR